MSAQIFLMARNIEGETESIVLYFFSQNPDDDWWDEKLPKAFLSFFLSMFAQTEESHKAISLPLNDWLVDFEKKSFYFIFIYSFATKKKIILFETACRSSRCTGWGSINVELRWAFIHAPASWWSPDTECAFQILKWVWNKILSDYDFVIWFCWQTWRNKRITNIWNNLFY